MLKVMLHFDGGNTMWFDMDEAEMEGTMEAWRQDMVHSFLGDGYGETFYVDMRAVRMIHVTGAGDDA